MDVIRDAPFGQLVRFITGNRVFKYPEEADDFECPPYYKVDADYRSPANNQSHGAGKREDEVESEPKPISGSSSDTDATDAEKGIAGARNSSNLHRAETAPHTEGGPTLEKTQSIPIVPARTADGTILADWYATDDPANPQNWSRGKKLFVALTVTLYTFAVYCSSSLYVSSTFLIMDRFGVGNTKAALGLALYVLGYGIGPLIFSPMSEIPMFGRNIPYITTFALFVILSLPTALVDNIEGLLVLRFLLGFLGSPCLANGGATMGDMYSFIYLPFPIALWVSAAFAAPALGPLVSGFAVYAENWRWSQWEVLWLSAPIFLLMFFFLPETHPHTILLQRAARIRKVSGNKKVMSQSEIDQRHLSFGSVFVTAMVKPMEICIKDPAVMFVNLYTALTYGIYYSFFESFPLVYGEMYGFNVGETGVVFLCIIIGCIIAITIYFSYLYFFLIPDIMKNGMRAQEWRLRPSLLACFGPTVGLFLAGWTSRESVHWIASVIGITIYATTVFILLQCIFLYIPMSYPQYAASLFASNDFFRSSFAFAAILFSTPMYHRLGIGRGVSLLGGLSVMGIFGMWLLYFYGAKLRARSKFAS